MKKTILSVAIALAFFAGSASATGYGNVECMGTGCSPTPGGHHPHTPIWNQPSKQLSGEYHIQNHFNGDVTGGTITSGYGNGPMKSDTYVAAEQNFENGGQVHLNLPQGHGNHGNKAQLDFDGKQMISTGGYQQASGTNGSAATINSQVEGGFEADGKIHLQMPVQSMHHQH